MIIFATIAACYSIFISVVVVFCCKKLKEKQLELMRLAKVGDDLERARSDIEILQTKNKENESSIESKVKEILELSKTNSSANSFLIKAEEVNQKLENKITALEAEIKTLNEANSTLAARESKIESEKKSLEEKIAEQKTFIEEAQKNLKTEFESIAAKHLKGNSEEFLTSSSSKLTDILKPYKDGIEALKTKVEETYKTEAGERISLKTHIDLLVSQSAKVESTAENLTKALKGDRKIQGNWGEFILEQLLENSGLKKGVHYTTQENFVDSEGKRQLPDVNIKLSEGKDIIIDSKVSLVAYERYFNDSSGNANQHAVDFITSVKSHIDKLSNKSYQDNPNINTLDFVIMFMPIEGTYQLAYQLDSEIFSYGWNRRVILTSPSTLFPLLKAIASMWKIDAQNKKQQEIIRLATSLYDKFISFGNSLEVVGSSIEKSQEFYDKAIKQLRDGDGSAVSLVKRLENYGIEKKPSKNKKMPVFMQELGEEIVGEISETKSEIKEE